MSYPMEARFGWQLDDPSVAQMGRYHRMAMYTHAGWPDSPRKATSAERVTCASLQQHGLRPSGPKAPPPAAATPAAPTPPSSESTESWRLLAEEEEGPQLS